MIRNLVVDLLIGPGSQMGKLTVLDEFAIYAGSVLLRLLHEYFAIKDFIDPKEWDIKEIDWKKYMSG